MKLVYQSIAKVVWVDHMESERRREKGRKGKRENNNPLAVKVC